MHKKHVHIQFNNPIDLKTNDETLSKDNFSKERFFQWLRS